MSTRWYRLRFISLLCSSIGCAGTDEKNGSARGLDSSDARTLGSSEPGAVIAWSRFGRGEDDDILYYWADLEIRVRPEGADPADDIVITTSDKPVGFVPFVRLERGARYYVDAYGGRFQEWNGSELIDSGFSPNPIRRNFGEPNDTLTIASTDIRRATIYSATVTYRTGLSDFWDPELDGGDRWYCDYAAQLGCSCDSDTPAERSWDTCPPVEYRCCMESEDGSACECQASEVGGFDCERLVEMNGGRIVSACPMRAAP